MSQSKKIISLLIFSVGLCSLPSNINANPFLWFCSSSKVAVYDPSRMNFYDYHTDGSDLKSTSNKGTASTVSSVVSSVQLTPNPSADALSQLMVPYLENSIHESSSPFSPRGKKTTTLASPTSSAQRRVRDQAIHHIIVTRPQLPSQDLRRMALGHTEYKYTPEDTTYIN